MSTDQIMDKGASVDVPKKRGRPVVTFEKHYTVSDACELLSISRSTFYQWLKEGLFHHVVKTPGGTRVPASVLNQFAENRRIVTCRS